MKPTVLVAGLAPLIAASLSVAPPSQAQQKFSCNIHNGEHATFAFTKKGNIVPIIIWKDQSFSDEGWSPQRRCQAVTKRFNLLYNANKLKYLTVGRMKGQSVICGSPTDDGGCAGLLYTLKPGQNAAETLNKLIAVRTNKGNGPLTETTARPYINLEEIEEKSEQSLQTQAETPVSQPVTNATTSPAQSRTASSSQKADQGPGGKTNGEPVDSEQW
ncbi:MAG: COP23 domain-containing protein [Cyanobacteriota bacterium]|nr:COP23 domain-containing protein [Cyanobacteriota bacterium]